MWNELLCKQTSRRIPLNITPNRASRIFPLNDEIFFFLGQEATCLPELKLCQFYTVNVKMVSIFKQLTPKVVQTQ